MHVTTKCVKNPYNLLEKYYPQQLYEVKPSYTRATVDQRGRYVMGETYWRQGMTYSYGDYGTDIPTP